MTNHDLHNLLVLDRSTLPPDGGPRFNRLIFSHSPYLLQHAENPVDWREWGEEAWEEARRRNLPLFVSIGYATCHWCHVMAHESFEDEEVADILNHAFVPVKVDREERPDLDEFCMAACQALTGRGGWPLNCLLKPDGTPFYAFSYLPKEPRGGMPGFLELLENLAGVWQHRQDAVERNAESLMTALRQDHGGEAADTADPALLADQAAATLQRIYDRNHPGFGSAPKFPMPTYLLLLLSRPDPAEREPALASLRAMAAGGIRDQLGGGIHRYSTDRHWLVPHFEKMLYDQALVAYAALEAFALTADQQYREMAEDLIGFVLRDLTAPDGGFYCALDADSSGREGACYVWHKEEINELLGDDAGLFCDCYGVTAGGNFEEPGENVLFLRRPPADPAEAARLAAARQVLLAARHRREQPLRDEKILTAWNGLMIAALARGAALTGAEAWLTAARRAATFIHRALTRDDGRLLRSWCSGSGSVPAFLEDYAFLAWGHLELFRANGDTGDLQRADQLCREALRLFRDDRNGLLMAGNDREQLPVNRALCHDGVTPSGPAVLLQNLLQLAELTNDAGWRQAAEPLLGSHLAQTGAAPVNATWLIRAATAA
ncbi:thioredoxin domain-containing protein [Trichlorobacter ammonificans]|uniref:Thymidylate kinase n=1 Tax=Trichlorobacter ammonificans TaxID=2916410 RepID=A0ABM9D6M3_9BACT|nr:thioredoxin domain-containing protein [Trichlorobacter ammonificans]CAH2030831.1 Thymidylate kinase [Trichlorobacter ammonificans]